MNCLSFCLSEKFFISSSILDGNLGKPGLQVLLFRALNVLCHTLLACKVSAEKSADRFMWDPLYMILYFSLVFRILY